MALGVPVEKKRERERGGGPLANLGEKTRARLHKAARLSASRSLKSRPSFQQLVICQLWEIDTSQGDSLLDHCPGCMKDNCTGMDWFAATVFLMMQGDAERTWNFLHKFSALAASGFMWTYRLHASVSFLNILTPYNLPPSRSQRQC